MAAAYADAWNASSVETARFTELAGRLTELSSDHPVERQVQIWLREVGLDGAREARDRYEAAGAGTLIFVLDEQRRSGHDRATRRRHAPAVTER